MKKETLLQARINNIFNELGLKITRSGYYLWTTLILQVYNQIDNIENFSNIHITQVYKELAKAKDSTYTKIERNLRTLIEDKQEQLQKYFNYNNRIDNKTFLIFMIRKLKMEENINANAERNKETNGEGIKAIL